MIDERKKVLGDLYLEIENDYRQVISHFSLPLK